MNSAELANIAAHERNHWWYRGMRSILQAMLLRHLPGRRIRRALEAGCGTGYTADWLRTHYQWNIVPVDIESAALRHVKNLQFPNSTQADIRFLPFRDATFDTVLNFDVFVHIFRGDERKCLDEFFRVLSPGGLLVLRAAALDALRSRHSQFIDEKQRFTRAGLRRAVTRSGFQILQCTYANSLLLPIAIAKFRILEPFLRKPPASGIDAVPGWLNALFYWPLALEAKLIGMGLNLPLGQSIVLIARKPG